MKTLIIILVLLLTTGCASSCRHSCIMGWGPGSPSFDAYGNHFNQMDPCQHYGKPEGYKLADFCFANAGKRVYYVKDVNNKIIYKIQ